MSRSLRATDAYMRMKLVTAEDYRRFASSNLLVAIGDAQVKIGGSWEIKEFATPGNYKLETGTVWNFEKRGDWATHTGKYRGNWSPYVPRNLILKYTQPGDLVLDQMCGSGTSLVEAKLLGRNAFGVDVNLGAVMVTLDRLNFELPSDETSYSNRATFKVFHGDARNLNRIASESFDLVVAHPPYGGIIRYSKTNVKGDLSSMSFEEYVRAMRKVAEEGFRVLKPGKHCGILIGDTRRHKHFVPISARVLQCFLECGFVLKEDIIKMQWKTKVTREKWRAASFEYYGFHRIAHEHLYVFRKPEKGEKLTAYKYSTKWFLEN